MTRIASPGRQASQPGPRLAPSDLATGPDYVVPIACGLALAVSLALAAVVYSLHHSNRSIAAHGMTAVTNVSLVREAAFAGTGSSTASAVATVAAPAPLSPAPADHDGDQVLMPTPTSIAALRPNAAEAMAEPPPAGAMRSGATATAFRRSLESHIARFRRYPSVVNNERPHGIVQISFDMDRNGAVSEVRIASSSGHVVLDAEAVNIVRRAAPLPAIPAELPSRLCILLPIDFAASSRTAF